MGTTTTSAPGRLTAAGRGRFVHEILGSFSPNRVISKAALRFIVAFQGAVLLIVWATSTYVFLPKPLDVWRAFAAPSAHMGLGQQLSATFLLTYPSMASATFSCL